MSYALLVKDSNGQREMLLVGAVTIGRDPSCDISTSDPRLSRRHAEFRIKPDGVAVFDLASRNGILVNGKKVTEAMLKPGDVVQVANVVITLISEADRVAPDTDSSDDKTSLLEARPVLPVPPPRPATAPPVPATPPVPAEDDQDEKTSFLAPPAGAARPPAPPAPPPRPPAPGPPPAPAPLARAPLATPVPGEALKPRTARKARGSWAGSVFLTVMSLSVLVLLVTAVSLLWWNSRVVDAMGDEQAVALANWLAADAATALETGRDLAASADAVGRGAGVITAVVAGLDGRVMAPATRTSETLSTIPGINVAPGDILRLRVEREGAVIHVARPVKARDQLRAAIVWVAYQPTPPLTAGSGPIVVGPSVIVAIVVGWLAAMRIRRLTLGGLSALNEDVDLAMGGQLEEVADPLGAKPVAELAETFNYLLARLRTSGPMERRVKGGDVTTGRREAARPAPPPSAMEHASAPPSARPAVPAPAGMAHEARIVCNPTFQVIEASPACEAVLGLPPKALVGKHLLETTADQALVDAVLKALGVLGASGEEHASVTTARGQRVALTVSRAGKDQPIAIVLQSA